MPPDSDGTTHASDAKNVLLIDDDEAVRRVFARVLSAAGFRTLLAEDGQRGLALLRESSPDAVLVDLQMPGLGGLDVLSELKKEAPDTPAIVISGSGVMDDVVQALRRGAWDYVTKPVQDSRLLIQALRSALEKSALIRENREQRSHLERLNGQLQQAVEELQTEQEAARQIQFQLLPADGMRIGDYRLTRRLFPSQSLSGDFIDYFPVGRNHLAFYLADVSGHGAASALVTTMLATLVGRQVEAFARGESLDILSPRQLLRSLNRDLGLQRLRKHVTMFYAVADLRTHRLVFGSAGQYPFPLVDDGERVRALESSGHPLGLFGDSQFAEHEIELESIRRLLLVSDGVLEILPCATKAERLDRLAALFQQAPDIDSIVRAFGIDRTDHYPDDVTLLLLERSV